MLLGYLWECFLGVYSGTIFLEAALISATMKRSISSTGRLDRRDQSIFLSRRRIPTKFARLKAGNLVDSGKGFDFQ